MSTPPYHIPVLCDEVVEFLLDTPEGPLVDGTLGGGGHLAALSAASGSKRQLVGVDRDRDALEEAAARIQDDRVSFRHGNFRNLKSALSTVGFDVEDGVAGILLDLGVSSWQLDSAPRGFAFRYGDAPLDMRMDQRDDIPTALDLVATLSEDELARTLREFGEVSASRRLAQSIKDSHQAGKLETAADLVRVIERTLPGKWRRQKTHPATTVFQALRIAVNDEMGALDDALEQAPDLLMDQGRLAVISYHSLEDRRVKHAFRLGANGPPRPARLPPPSDWKPTWEVLTSRAIKASDEEVKRNPRARSARLRVAKRVRRENRGAYA